MKPGASGPNDGGPGEAGTDIAVTDLGAADAAVTDRGTADVAVTDLGAAEVGVTDLGSADAGVTDVGVTDVGATDAGASDVPDDRPVVVEVEVGTPDTLPVADAGANDAFASGDVVPIGGTPVEQCNALVGVICSRLVECRMATVPEQMQCNRVLNVELGCARATSPAFPPCIADTRALTCDALFTTNGLELPASCTTPLDIPLSDAQSKCVDLVAANCARAYRCMGIVPTAAQLNTCVRDTIFAPPPDGIPCLDVVSVGPTYDMCLVEINAACTPTDGGVPPDGGTTAFPSCVGVLTLVE